MVEPQFSPINIQIVGYKFKDLQDFESYIKMLSDQYGSQLGVFCAVLPNKKKRVLDKLLKH